MARVEDVRNVALVGHGAVGKTTLAEVMLHRAGVTNRLGSVDDGTSILDADEEERERKFSTSSHLSHFTHAGKQINVFDTPGYPDFIGQTIGALRGVETAVIMVAADTGIAVNTRKTFAYATEAGLGRMILLNKFDHDHIDFGKAVAALQETFGRACLPLNAPTGLGSGFTGVVSVLQPGSASSPVADVGALQQQVLDAIAESDEALMEKYLGGESLTPDEIRGGIVNAIRAGTLIPVLCACAKTGVGVPEFMDALADFALSPSALPRKARSSSGGELDVSPSIDAPLIGQVVKTRIDPFVSKLSFIRLFSGRITKETQVVCTRSGKTLKINQLFHLQGNQQEPIEEAGAGDIVAVVKIDDLHTGDTICNGKADISLPEIKYPTPMIGLAVEPKSRNDQTKISGALHKIEEEDPTFRVLREAQTHELVMQGMSELHLQIVTNRLQKRDKVEVLVHPPKVPYRETCTGAAEGSYRHKKQSGGSGQFAEVHLRVASLPQGIVPEEHFTKERFPGLREFHYDKSLNFAFIDRVSGGTVPNQFIPAVEKGVIERMTKGVVAGYQVQDCSVELYFGKDHPVDSNETAFRIAGSMCFREVFKNARPQLLEPIMHVEITVPGEKFGDITSDLNSRRGRVEGMDTAGGGYQVIKARVPLSEMMTYSRSLSSMTGGQGSFTMEFSHYEVMPPNEQQKVIAAAAAHLKEEEE